MLALAPSPPPSPPPIYRYPLLISAVSRHLVHYCTAQTASLTCDLVAVLSSQ